MTIDETVTITNLIKPKVVVPIHYGTIVGVKTLGSEFKKKIDKKIKCQLLLKFEEAGLDIE